MRKNQQALIVPVILAVLLFVFLVRLSLNLSHSRRNFRNEMAQRLDLEEKISVMEKERQEIMGKMRLLQTRLDMALLEARTASQELERERKEMTSLRSSVEKLKTEKSSPSL
ncbi:MAG: hypothetical protein WC732_01190 [Candidatus Omnitrophota bacterium]